MLVKKRYDMPKSVKKGIKRIERYMKEQGIKSAALGFADGKCGVISFAKRPTIYRASGMYYTWEDVENEQR